jgi:hypothetical protein
VLATWLSDIQLVSLRSPNRLITHQSLQSQNRVD